MTANDIAILRCWATAAPARPLAEQMLYMTKGSMSGTDCRRQYDLRLRCGEIKRKISFLSPLLR